MNSPNCAICIEFCFVIFFFRKVLFDGKCPICVHEIRLLKRKDRKKQNVVWVDISQDQYQAADHANIDYVTAMGAMHVIDKNGTVKFYFFVYSSGGSKIFLRGNPTPKVGFFICKRVPKIA